MDSSQQCIFEGSIKKRGSSDMVHVLSEISRSQAMLDSGLDGHVIIANEIS